MTAPRTSRIAGHPYNLRPSDHALVEQHARRVTAGPIPSSVKVAQPPVWPLWEQGSLGCCCEHGVLKAILFVLWKKYQIDPTTALARLFSYYNGRVKEGTVGEDSGLSVIDGITVNETFGAALETLCPYDIAKFTEKPSDQAYADAKLRLVIAKQSLPCTFDGIRQGLADGYPVIIGMTLKQSFESTPASGIVPIPAKNESALGGHCMLIWEAHTLTALKVADDHPLAQSWLSEAVSWLVSFVEGQHGYGAPLGPATTENWWGAGFGDSGYVHLDGAILNHDCFDCWQITDVQLVPAT